MIRFWKSHWLSKHLVNLRSSTDKLRMVTIPTRTNDKKVGLVEKDFSMLIKVGSCRTFQL